MNFVIQELYESVLITEMNQKVVDYLNQNTDKLPFDHIFGDKMRVAFPIGTDITAQSIIDDLKRIQHFDKVDLKSGEVVRKIKLDPKYGQGDYKEQRINMGKVISALKIAEDKKKKYLDWFARYKDNLEAAFEKPEYIIILSRAPIDVVRMSDHRNISSCHSQGGSYFHCAIQEAITGGAVAYVVKSEDFDELTEEEFQNDEIFVDTDRGIRGAYGLRPISRLRVRRLIDDDENEVAIPDTKIYGNQSIPNFYNSLRSYLQSKQSVTSTDFSNKNVYTKRGGTYYDDTIGDLIADYFSDDKNRYHSSDFKRIKHDHDDEYGEQRHSTIGLEDELKNIQERYNPQMTYTQADYYLYDDEAMFQPSGYSKIDISRFNLPDDVDLMVEDDYGIRDVKNGNKDDVYEYSTLVEYLENKNDNRIYRIEMTNKEIEISFGEEEFFRDPDKFDTYCYYLKRFDDQIDDMLDDEDELLETFIDAGFIKIVEGEDKDFTMIEDYINMEEEPFDHLTISGGNIKKSFNVKFPNRLIIMEDIHNALKEAMRGMAHDLPKLQMQHIIKNLAMENFKPKSDENDIAQLQFDKFFESYTNPLDGINYVLSLGIHFNYGDLEITNMTLNFPKMDNKNYQFVEFVDDMYSHIINAYRLSVLYALNTIGTHKNEFYELSEKYNYPQLYKLYYKYL
jgi:hypothetical protein